MTSISGELEGRASKAALIRKKIICFLLQFWFDRVCAGTGLPLKRLSNHDYLVISTNSYHPLDELLELYCLFQMEAQLKLN